jgi:hypothetical protein
MGSNHGSRSPNDALTDKFSAVELLTVRYANSVPAPVQSAKKQAIRNSDALYASRHLPLAFPTVSGFN